MTYIAAFRCEGGIVMCADTLESFEYDEDGHKEYVEKLEIGEEYPISIGGAGVGEIIEAATQEILDRCRSAKPANKSALRKLVLASLEKVYKEDVPVLVIDKQARSPELLISAKPEKDDFRIFRVRGRRVWDIPDLRIVGYGTKYNKELLRRLFRADLSMLQAVALATYLVSQSKLVDKGVGGEIRITVVTNRGAFQEKPTYISYLETRARDFIKQTDALFLACLDTSLGEKRLRKEIKAFTDDVIVKYRSHIDATLEGLTMKEAFEYHPYQKTPMETAISFGMKGLRATHDEAENERIQGNFRRAKALSESMRKPSKPQTLKDQP